MIIIIIIIMSWTIGDMTLGKEENIIIILLLLFLKFFMGTKGNWDFQISDLVKNPDGTDI